MAIIVATITDDCRKFWPQIFGGIFPFEPITTFKVGEGGWINPGGGPIPRTPDSTLRDVVILPNFPYPLQDIDAIVDQSRSDASLVTRYPSNRRGHFEKALGAPDFSFEAPSTLRIRCRLDFTDFNDNGSGFNPQIWELGVFSLHPDQISFPGQKLMVAYGTLPQEIKDNTKQLENIMRIVF